MMHKNRRWFLIRSVFNKKTPLFKRRFYTIDYNYIRIYSVHLVRCQIHRSCLSQTLDGYPMIIVEECRNCTQYQHLPQRKSQFHHHHTQEYHSSMTPTPAPTPAYQLKPPSMFHTHWYKPVSLKAS